MATIADLPYHVLSLIIILLVRSSNGASQLARILSVCRTFLAFKEDVNILKLVRFKKNCSRIQMYQNVNGLLIRCSEAGNISAQFLLGKVILISSFQLFLSERRKLNLAHSLDDRAFLLKLHVPTRNTKVGSFMSYFLPEQAFTSETSQTRLVHYQLVKVFLVSSSHDELLRMGIQLQTYIEDYTRVIKDSTLLNYVNHLLFYASRIRKMMKVIKRKERLDYACRLLTEVEAGEEESQSKCQEDPSNSSAGQELYENATICEFLLEQFISKCEEAGVHWLEALNVETRYYHNCLSEAYTEFWECRSLTVSCFDTNVPKFAKCFEELCKLSEGH